MDNWKQAFWKDVKNIGLMILAISGFVLFAQLPDDTLIKDIFAIAFMVVFVLLVLMFTSLGNPIKKMIRKYQDNKNGKV